MLTYLDTYPLTAPGPTCGRYTVPQVSSRQSNDPRENTRTQSPYSLHSSRAKAPHVIHVYVTHASSSLLHMFHWLLQCVPWLQWGCLGQGRWSVGSGWVGTWSRRRRLLPATCRARAAPLRALSVSQAAAHSPAPSSSWAASTRTCTGRHQPDHLTTATSRHISDRHPSNGLFSRTTWVIRHQKGQSNLDFKKQEMMGWQWHQLDYMQIICTLPRTDNHASTSSVNFLQARCSSWRPNQQCQSTEGKSEKELSETKSNF